jgi:hypothetical protein
MPLTFLMRDSVMKLIKQKCFSFVGQKNLIGLFRIPVTGL